MTTVTKVCILSIYGPTDYGFGHIVDGRPLKSGLDKFMRISVLGGSTEFIELLEQLTNLEKLHAGERIRVTIETMPDAPKFKNDN